MKSPYIRFLVKAVLLVFVFVLMDYLVGFVYGQLRDSAFKKNTLSQEFSSAYCIEKATPDIAIIGSSTANHHYIPSMMEDSLGMSVYNFGRDGCFFYFQNALINIMIDRYSPSYIIWEIGESSLSSTNNKHDEYQSMNLLYTWYSNTYAKEYIDNKDAFQKIRMLSSCYRNNSDLLMYLRLNNGNNNSTLQGYVPLYNTNDYPSMKSSVKDHYSIDSQKIDVLNQTIRHCKAAGVTLVFSSSPRYYDSCVKSTDYYQALTHIATKNSIPFMDYYNLPPFCNDSTLFKDNDHMNNDGTVLYMSVFIPSLRKVLQENPK